MPLKPALDLIRAAQRGGYAVGYFESWNLESLQGVIDAAEQTRSPVLIGFNGEFLSRKGRKGAERLEWYAALAGAAASTASVPCGLVFNECSDWAWVERAVAAGFGLVMPDPAGESLEEFVRTVAGLVARAHRHGVAVEAELGHLPVGTSGVLDRAEATLTDPAQAAEFVRATGIDVLAVSVGNVHILLEGSKALDLDRLAAIRRKADVPLDLHGGSGIGPGDLREAIRMGVAKVCYGTCVKQWYLAAVRDALGKAEVNPHRLLGWGGDADVLVAGRQAVCQAVRERIGLLGCCGRA